jgi:hypothetical protein
MTIEDCNFRYIFLKQIRKDKARKLFYSGIEIYILPKDINPYSYHNLTKSIKCTYNVDFDVLIKFERKDRFNNKNGYLNFYYIDLDNPRQIQIKY